MLLSLLHLVNDGSLSAMPLFLPLIQDEIVLPMSFVGALGAILSFSGIVLAIPAGLLSAFWGAERTLAFAAGTYALGFLLLGFSSSPLTLSLAFLVSSLGFGIFHPVAFTAVARRSGGRIGARMGTFAASGDVGKIVLAALVTFLSSISSWRHTAFLYALISLLVFLIALRFSFQIGKEHPDVKRRAKIDFSLLGERRYVAALSASFLDTLANGSLFIFLPFLIIYRGFDSALLGSFTALFFFGNLLGKVVMGQLSDLFSLKRTFIICELLIALFLIVLSLSSSLWIILVAAFFLGILTKGTVPVTSTMVAEAAGEGKLESAYSLSSIVTSLAGTLSPLLLGFIGELAAIPALFLFSSLLALLSALVITIS